MSLLIAEIPRKQFDRIIDLIWRVYDFSFTIFLFFSEAYIDDHRRDVKIYRQ